MTRYPIDTTPLSALVASRPTAVSLITPWMAAREAVTRVLIFGEVLEGLKGRPNFRQRHAQLLTLIQRLSLGFVDVPIMQRYADIRRELRPPTGPGLIGDIDTLIAATALEYGLIVVTCDTDCMRVLGLAVHLIPRASL